MRGPSDVLMMIASSFGSCAITTSGLVGKPPPMKVRCIVTVKKDGEEGPLVAPVLGTTAQLDYVGQEITVFRFRLDEAGHIQPGSVNSLYKPLRTQGSK